MLHPATELRIVSEEVGYGVFATAPIPRGTITWALDPLDQILDASSHLDSDPRLAQTLERYTWRDGSGRRILCWDFGRFMNHSCAANSLSPGGFEFEIAVYDIAAGDQLTSDYGALNLETAFACQCGYAECRQLVEPGDFEIYASAWDKKIRSAFPHIRDVQQPLITWLERYEGVIEQLAARPEFIPSILKHRWQRPSNHPLPSQKWSGYL